MRYLALLVAGLGLTGCKDDDPPPSPVVEYVRLKQELGDIAHRNQLDCNEMTVALEGWFAEHGQRFAELDRKAEAGELEAEWGAGLLGKNNNAQAAIKTYVGACVGKSKKLAELTAKHGL